MTDNILTRLKQDSLIRANEYFLQHKNELIVKNNINVTLIFCRCVQVIESLFEANNCYQFYYEIRPDDLSIAYYEMMFEYSELGEPLDDYCQTIEC